MNTQTFAIVAGIIATVYAASAFYRLHVHLQDESRRAQAKRAMYRITNAGETWRG